MVNLGRKLNPPRSQKRFYLSNCVCEENVLLSTLHLGAGLFLGFRPTTAVCLKLWKSRASFPASPATSPAFATVQGGPNEGRNGWELLGHRPQQAELAQVPELERGGGEGDDEVLFALAQPDHRHSLLLWFATWVVSQVSASTRSKVSRHEFVPDQGGTSDGTVGEGKDGSCRLAARPLYRCYWGRVYCYLPGLFKDVFKLMMDLLHKLS